MAIKRLLPALLLLLAGAARAATTPYTVFPLGGRLFNPLLADPRQVQLSAAYYRLKGDNIGDIALGHDWGMARWFGAEDAWVWQWDLEAQAFSRFKISGGINEFETVDFYGAVPIEVRHGDLSGKFSLYHQSSHLGDDYIRDTGDEGFRYSQEGVSALFSDDASQRLRLYGGGSYLIHTVPAFKRGALQGGFELTSPELGLFKSYPFSAYLAEDVQSRRDVAWNISSNTTLGLRLGFKQSPRTARFYLSYFTGHSPFGQFYAQREHYAEIGIGFDF